MGDDGISVIIPVLHEADIIQDQIKHLQSIQRKSSVEIIVIDGAEEADTIMILDENDTLLLKAPKGRGIQMNRGAEASSGDILVFLHADTKLPSNAFKLIRDTLDDGRYHAGAFTLDFKEAPFYLRMTLPIHGIRGRLTRIPYGDQVIFMKKETFERLGGYREIMLMEDLEIMRRMRRSGMKIQILKDKVWTSSRRFLKKGILKTILKNIYLISLFHLGADPEKLARKYYDV